MHMTALLAFVYIHLIVCLMLTEIRRQCHPFATRVLAVDELPCDCLETNPGPPQEWQYSLYFIYIACMFV